MSPVERWLLLAAVCIPPLVVSLFIKLGFFVASCLLWYCACLPRVVVKFLGYIVTFLILLGVLAELMSWVAAIPRWLWLIGGAFTVTWVMSNGEIELGTEGEGFRFFFFFFFLPISKLKKKMRSRPMTSTADPTRTNFLLS